VTLNVNDDDVGQKKLFHIKEYLCPKEIQEKGLSPILLAMEVVEYANPGRKKPLLKHLWPDTSKSFNEIFGHYIEKRGEWVLFIIVNNNNNNIYLFSVT